ncbi:MAG: pirin family protein [Phycisphaeraceae bacterium]|nr:MAG: pirin family protein [Phycisphaeraceae bacterium]
MNIRRSADRGTTDIDWLKSRHTFSFGEYHDPAHMGFRSLRVINDDLVAPGQGFDTHGHRDMEIITVVLSGALEHKDSLGHGEVLRPGEVQVMTAGRGIRHSEFNPSRDTPVHLIQIWIRPQSQGLPPAYAQREFPQTKGRLARVAGRDGLEPDGALKINQDADLFVGTLAPRQAAEHTLRSGRGVWVHVAEGSASVNTVALSAGDAAAIEQPGPVQIAAGEGGATVLLFDLA